MMVKRVLVALDDSPTAEKALMHIVGLGRGFDLDRIGLINVRPSLTTVARSYGDSAMAMADPGLSQRIADDLEQAGKFSRKLLEKAKAYVEKQDFDGVEVVTHDEEGPTAKRILDAVREHDYDLLIMGSRGMGRAAGLIMGSVSHAVITNLPCSVFIVDADSVEEEE